MRRLFNMLLFFIGLLLLVLILSAIYQLKIIGISKTELAYQLLLTLRINLPLILSSSLFFGLIFSDPYMSQDVKGTLLSILFFIVFALAFHIFISEILIPKVYQKTELKLTLAHFKQKKPPVKEDISGSNFMLKEFAFTKYYPSRRNIVFRSGKLLFAIGQLTRINQVGYLRQVRVFAYNKNNNLEYSIFSDYAKVISQEIHLYRPTYITYDFMERPKKTKHFDNNKTIPLYYDINALWNFPNDQDFKDFNLFAALANSDYLLNSGISFIRLGNIIYNKICSIITLLILLIIGAAAGQSLELKKSITSPKEIPGLISLLMIAPAIFLILYAFISSLFSFIYTLIV